MLLPFHISFNSSRDYLLSIRGLGLKSVECVRLLTLHHMAFPVCFLVPQPPKDFSSIFLILKLCMLIQVDTNVGRICVRLGWVPLQPLPESLQLHLLEMYVSSFSVVDLYPYMISHDIWVQSSIMKVSHAGAHTEIPLASTMQARSTDIVRLVQSIYLIIYLAGQIHWCLPLCRYELHYQMITFGKVVNVKLQIY